MEQLVLAAFFRFNGYVVREEMVSHIDPVRTTQTLPKLRALTAEIHDSCEQGVDAFVDGFDLGFHSRPGRSLQVHSLVPSKAWGTRHFLIPLGGRFLSDFQIIDQNVEPIPATQLFI